MNLKIRNSSIGKNDSVYFIADIASNHCGDLDKAKELIWSCAEAGANAAKFQNFTAESLVSDYGFRHLTIQAEHQKKWKKSVYDSYDDASIPLDWTPILQETAHKAGIDFLTSPYSIELLEKTSPYLDAIKLGSGDITYHEIINEAARSSLPLIISTGASSINEVEMAMKIVNDHEKKVVLMQCNTNYTAKTGDDENAILSRFKNIELAVLDTYIKKFPNVILGLSDHTHGHITVLGAVGIYGARVIEKHFTLDNSKEGQDHAFSMNPKTWSEMVKTTNELQCKIHDAMSFDERFRVTAEIAEDPRALEISIGSGVKSIQPNEERSVVVQRRSICASSDLSKGQVLGYEHFACLRPAPPEALPPYRVSELIGKSLLRNITKGENISLKDVS